ncbi:MAG TPA: PilW family protein [Aquabacterium sp.]|uniref:PilW family protein n=1 Tax=Aquabacterium sp. TaxID=1872578 RepID=UPI002E2F48A7|nr:PilW family protein [Aquabacterium sp.]HEX5357723.1 PilW family protein [Aquabacterium sp.]
MGLTLVELMVSMVIGLAVIGAGMAMYTTSGFAGKGSSALSQMGEDATLALSLMRNHIAMAGYSRMVLDPANNTMVKLYNGHPVFGCRFGVTSDTNDNFLSSTDPASAQVSCDNGLAAGNDTLIVLYEADQDNTIANGAAAPTDCLGNGLPPPITTNPLGSYSIAENRFFINANNALSCRGNSGAPPQPLVDNVAQMQILYGVATPSPTGTRGTVATRYLRANQVGDMNSGNWDQVVSVRLCLVIQSREPVLDAPAPFFDCNGVSTPTTDRRLYRAFSTTVVLNNRIFPN